MTEYNMNNSIQVKIKERMDILQSWMESDYHLSRPLVVKEHIETISKFWSVLQEEDTDYINGSLYAIENKLNWKENK